MKYEGISGVIREVMRTNGDEYDRYEWKWVWKNGKM